jgi:acetoin utilization deacetylase AcuC-like enzyme
MLRTALVTDRRYLDHHAGRSHPERPERAAAMNEMAQAIRRSDLKFVAPRAALVSEVALCHTPEYVAAVERTSHFDRVDLDPDTHTSRESYRTAMLSAGGVLTAVQTVLDGEASNAFAIVRPPGHHALPDRAMGFCIFNNVAIAAKWLLARENIKRVMILDWDVHHGNGTQDAFYETEQVLYVSLHQYPHYPGTGAIGDIGFGAGTGFTVNCPMPAGWGDAEYIRVFDRCILPIGRQYEPDFILVSAGFDCHFRDPLASMNVTEDGFRAMTRRLKRLAAESCEGRMVAALEGGYDIEALVNSGAAVIDELGREADEPIHPEQGGDRAMAIVERIAARVGSVWKLG